LSDKKINMRLIFFALFFYVANSIFAQAPFSRGVNLTGWFQVNTPEKIRFAWSPKRIPNNKMTDSPDLTSSY